MVWFMFLLKMSAPRLISHFLETRDSTKGVHFDNRLINVILWMFTQKSMVFKNMARLAVLQYTVYQAVASLFYSIYSEVSTTVFNKSSQRCLCDMSQCDTYCFSFHKGNVRSRRGRFLQRASFSCLCWLSFCEGRGKGKIYIIDSSSVTQGIWHSHDGTGRRGWCGT